MARGTCSDKNTQFQESEKASMNPSITKIFLVIGIIFILLAGLSYIFSRLNIPLGKLPGDILIQGKNLTCFIPLATSILLSIVLSLILMVVSRFIGRK